MKWRRRVKSSIVRSKVILVSLSTNVSFSAHNFLPQYIFSDILANHSFSYLTLKLNAIVNCFQWSDVTKHIYWIICTFFRFICGYFFFYFYSQHLYQQISLLIFLLYIFTMHCVICSYSFFLMILKVISNERGTDPVIQSECARNNLVSYCDNYVIVLSNLSASSWLINIRRKKNTVKQHSQ